MAAAIVAADDKKTVEIAATLRGPGPAKYRLPGTVGFMHHDPTRKRDPAFSFGTRFATKVIERSPGPCYHIPKNMTKEGKDNAPAYSLYGRQNGQSNFQTPAPGNYMPEKYPIPNDRKAPSYSLRGRMRFGRDDQRPAANAYTLPSLIGPNCPVRLSAAAHSISGRPKIGAYYEDLQKTPGPGSYKVTDLVLLSSPAYSIKGRPFDGREKTHVPGPGQYSPEKVWVHKKNGPKFSFGIRHSEYMTRVKDS
eukprot:gene12711-14016_t